MIRPIVTFVVALLVMAQAPHVSAQCSGDCHGDGEVTVDELIVGVNIALGSTPVGQCASFDSNSDGEVTINELIGAVNNALNGCQASAPTPTATPLPEPSPTPTSSIVPPGISTQMLGTWSGHAVNDTNGTNKPATIKVEVIGGNVVITDVGGNVFVSGHTLTANVTTPTAVVVARTVGTFPGGYAEALQLALAPNGQLAGTYGTTTLSFPPTVNAVALILDKQP